MKEPKPAASVVPVAYLLLEKQGEILLVRSLRQSVEGPWSIPSCVIGKGELPRAAAARLGKDEFGLELTAIELERVHTSYWVGGGDGGVDTAAYMFFARRRDGYFAVDRQQRGEVRWMPWSEVPLEIGVGPREMLERIGCEGMSYSELREVVVA